MSKYVDYYAGKAQEMIRNDSDRVDLFQKIDEMVELDWDLPEVMDELKWMRKVVSTDPLSAITVGRRTLSTNRPKVFMQPLNDNIVTKKMANWNEQNLLMQLKQANKRAEFDVIGDVVESALRYGMVAVMTVPVKWQLEGTKQNRWIKDPGGFMVMVEKPINVYPRYSPLGLESVLHVKLMRAEDAVAFWGDKAKKIKSDLMGDESEPNIVIYDYWDYDRRATWASALTRLTDIPEQVNVQYVLEDTEMDLPFMPWTVKKTGTSLSTSEDHRVRPTFGSIAHSDSWELQNIAKTFAFSEALGYAAAPRGKVTSYDDETLVEMIEYGDINRPIRLKPNETYEPLQPPAIDQNLLHILDRTSAEMDRITGMKNLQNLDLPSGTAFATVNELIKAASSSLDPARELAQGALAGIFENMLKWCAHTKEDMTSLGDGSKEDAGKQYRLRWEHIQPDAIDVEVELTAHVPTDRLQQINAGVMMNKELNYPITKIYRDLGEENPEEIVEEWEQEQFDRTVLQNELKKLAAEGDAEIMEMMQPPQQGGGMNEESMSQARMANGGMPPTRTGAPRREAQSQAARGLGFNPARGGLSPNQADPAGFLREALSGVDQRGNVV